MTNDEKLDAILARLESLPSVSRDERKEIFKEAFKEWLDNKYAAFGKWSIRALGAAALVALIYFILMANGWHK